MIEALDDEPLLHAVMGARRDIIRQTFSCLGDGLIHELLKPRDLVSEGIGLPNGKNLARNALGQISHDNTASLLE
jgi:hypothetical protein